ncbi:MAG TPA: hypothetical protein VKO42_04255 [Patescibacteria group bacterium]|nr:hypothetical protein [Patescibacteria group bacterium]
MDTENKNQNQNGDQDPEEEKENYFFFHYDEDEEDEDDAVVEGEIKDWDQDGHYLFNKDQDNSPEEINSSTSEEENSLERGEDSLSEDSISQIAEELSTEQENASSGQGEFSLSASKAALVKKLLKNIQENNEKLLQMFADVEEEGEKISFSEEPTQEQEENADNIIEGVFDGENMIGPDGRKYSVPLNYASKSKLVEGDILKLTITEKGNFKYKQIHPIQRARIVGELKKGTDGNYYVVKNGQKWRVLSAGVTYFKGDPGDEVALLIPAEGDSKWGAIENIIKK